MTFLIPLEPTREGEQYNRKSIIFFVHKFKLIQHLDSSLFIKHCISAFFCNYNF